MFGFGVGWLEPEFDQLGVPFADRAHEPTSTSRPPAHAPPMPGVYDEGLVQWVEQTAADLLIS